MIREIMAKTAITRTKIPVAKYVINPYIGCTFGCLYCYARFIGPFKYTGYKWGKDVLVKTNVAQLVEKELIKTKGDFFLSSICDPYQHMEKKYEMTRKIIQILTSHFRKVHIMTKSNLILRDIDLLKDLSVTLTITTDREDVRKILEPGAPSVEERFETLRKLKEAGIDVSVFVGPVIVMDAEHLAYMLSKYVDRVMLDALNYHRQVQMVYEKYGWTDWLTKDKFLEVVERFERVFGKGSVRY
ncbi:MAG TPA: radical SAM protein [Pseudothermotoga sp.]